MIGRSVSIIIKSKVFGGDIGLSEGSDTKSFDELLDLSDLDRESILEMAEQGVLHFAEKEYGERGGNHV